jgi:hypothetical protein
VHWVPSQWASTRREEFAHQLGARAVIVFPAGDAPSASRLKLVVEPIATAELLPTTPTHINKHKTGGNLEWQ